MKQLDQKHYRTAIYLRLSREDGDVGRGNKNESNSISNQKSLILDYLQDKPEFQIQSVWEDDGYSGVDFNRPAFQRMMEEVKDGKIDCIVVKDLSRFGRNYIETGRYLEKIFPLLGIRVIAVNDRYDSQFTDEAGDLMMPFKNLINDSYCRDLSVKIRSCLAVKRKKGEFVGAFACYGYQKDPENRNKLLLDPCAGQIVRKIFRWKLQGFSPNKIAQILNECGILSPLEYKRSSGSLYETSFQTNSHAKWNAKAVSRILSNEIYTGTLIQGKQTTPNYKVKIRHPVPEKEQVRMEGACPAVIDSYFFETIQNLLLQDTRTSPEEKTVFPLAGLVFCGDCGYPLIRKTTSYHSRENGKERQYTYLSCRGYREGMCKSIHRVAEDTLIETVLEAINRQMDLMEKVCERIEQILGSDIAVQQYKNQLLQKENERLRTERLLLHVCEDFEEGLLSETEYKQIKQEFEHRLCQTATAIESLQREKSNKDFCSLPDWVQQLKKENRIRKLNHAIASAWIHRILLYRGERVKIIWNFDHNPVELQER
ncbi:MAG: recombinase family protein [Candidatus Merdivicinus sp.]|jgi:site-specific DNA recombinase